MKLSCNILKRHIKNSNTIDFVKIWDKFTIRTAEVESVEVKGENTTGIITAKIVECESHPQSKKLHVLKVDTGEKIIQVVCGAPNVHVGLIGALVTVGGQIDGMEIGVRPLLGVESNGMMCSEKELGISDKHETIIELPEDTKIGVDINEIIPINDVIVEIDNKSLTHRPDLWGHYGIAREIAAITKNELIPLQLEECISNKESLNIKINNPELCYRYIGLKVGNITNNITPFWMKTFLNYVGMRSINYLVDLTNYVMLELGTPMHAFDERIVKGIEVGLAKEGDKFTTLDNEERTLSANDLMTKNDGKYFAVAGVMGGRESEIIEDTTSIFLESAVFEPTTVRKTALSLGLRTEASARYEKGLDPNQAIIATKRYISLLKEYNNNLTYLSSLTDIYPSVQKENEIVLKKDLLYKFMGFEIEDEIVTSILKSLEFKVENTSEDFKITVPTNRSTKDVVIPQDVIEEIARMYGYENFKPVPLEMAIDFKKPEPVYENEKEVKKLLSTAFNLNEVHTYLWNKTSFLKQLGVTFTNTKLVGKSEDHILRNDLSLSMLEVANTNINNRSKFGIFEIGTVIDKEVNKRLLSFLLTDSSENLKSIYNYGKNLIVDLFKFTKNNKVKFEFLKVNDCFNPDLTQGIIINNKVYGYISVFNKSISNKVSKKNTFVIINIDFDKFCELKVRKTNYKELSKYPETTLDYTIIMERGKYYRELEVILNAYTNQLIIDRKLIDIYLDGDTKKVTIRYTVGSNIKTLESKELNDFKTQFITYIKEHNLNIIEE